jgi:hypothetical protein
MSGIEPPHVHPSNTTDLSNLVLMITQIFKANKKAR